MIARYRAWRGSRIRRAVLKGLYEENLRILGRGPRRLRHPRPHPWLKAGLAAAAAAFVIGSPGSYFSPSPENAGQIRAGFYAPPAPPPAVEVHAVDAAAFETDSHLPLRAMMGLGVRTILIDPGHGGDDTGAIGHEGTNEKDLVLDIARRLKRRLDAHGRYRVLLTRPEDTTLSLERRVEIARESAADFFVSVHVNYLPKKPINIIETFYFGPSPDEETVSLAARENEGAEYGMHELKTIIEKMGTKLKLEESRDLAAAIQRSLFSNTKKDDDGVFDFGIKRAPFVVLLGVEVPAVLAEVSCLSNREAEKKLNTERHREDIARYLETGILDYIQEGDVTYESKG